MHFPDSEISGPVAGGHVVQRDGGFAAPLADHALEGDGRVAGNVFYQVTADGPGTGITLIFFSLANFTKNSPGSEIKGVPASDIRDIIFPPSISSKISLHFFVSLNL